MKIKTDAMLAVVAAAVGAALPLAADAEEVSATLSGFRLDTSGIPVVLSSQSDVDSFSAYRPVTYLPGDTVTVVSPTGAVSTLVEDAPAAGGRTFTPDAGGLWRIANSKGSVAYVGVGWSVFGDGTTQMSSPLAPIAIHTAGPGPDRRGRVNEFPPVAYSGDYWIGDASKAVRLTFTPPAESGLSPTVINRTGTGIQSFTFDEAGSWTVLMEMADGTTREATVFVKAGFVLMVL